MNLFWAKGYEGTQVSDLTAAMGINPPSFYAAFGSKEVIFREALDVYLATVAAETMGVLDTIPDAVAAVRAMLRASADTALASPSSEGCMISLGLLNHQPQNEPLRVHLRDLRRTTTERIRQRLERGVADGQLAADTNTARLATFFAMILQGLSVQARDGATSDDLAGLVASAMAILNPSPR